MSLATKLTSLDAIIKQKKQELQKITVMKKKELEPLIKQQEALKNELYRYMKSKNLEIYQGLPISTVAPKEAKKKPHKEEAAAEEAD